MKSFLHRRVPPPGHPACGRGVFLIIAFYVVLQVGSSVVLVFLQQVGRDIHGVCVKRDILELDKQLLALGSEKRQVALDVSKVVLFLLPLQLSPGVFQLRPFERL